MATKFCFVSLNSGAIVLIACNFDILFVPGHCEVLRCLH
jgi:hypothetical protein